MGGPGHLENTLAQLRRYILLWFFVSGLFIIGAWWLTSNYTDLSPLLQLGLLAAFWTFITLIVGTRIANTTSAPLKAISEAILHISPSPLPVKSPDVEKLILGRELISGLIRQVYELGKQGGNMDDGLVHPNVAMQQLPIAILAIDETATITFANLKAQQLADGQTLTTQNLYTAFDILFQGNVTLADWTKDVRAKSITAQKIWRGVRLSVYNKPVQYVDIAASYSKQADKGTEVLLTLFDQNDFYTNQDNSLSFIALAVHELRTPLTILRGYIEVLEEDLASQNNPQLLQIMQKMRASAENLTAFVGNILDVARVEQNQLSLKLNQEDWPKVLKAIVDDMQLRAQVHGKNIELSIGENIPVVGIDRVSIAEVMTNLLDNAIKYSPPDKKVLKVISNVSSEGLVETSVQDFGVGIPESVLPHLFEKFSRNHRNRASIGGTGLGLYLSKALIAAHGGNIWVRSHEGQGSVFSFTILPFSKVANMQQNKDNTITRNAHGWIKNHSLSRR